MCGPLSSTICTIRKRRRRSVAPNDFAPLPPPTHPQAAIGRPVGVPTPCFGDYAAQLFDNGYEPLPIVPGTKRPALSRWSTVPIDLAAIETWSRTHAACGIGLRTGHLVGVDIDILDPDLSHQMHALAQHLLGDTLMRVGHWPKRLLIYRSAVQFKKRQIPGVEILGLGQQFVAFGVHPNTGQPYHWPLGETPLEVPLDALATLDETKAETFLSEALTLLPERQPPIVPSKQFAPTGPHASMPLRDANGRVIDNRDAWLSNIAYHMVWDAVDRGDALDQKVLAARVWAHFAETADLSRPRQSQQRLYGPSDAAGKVANKLRLLQGGRLSLRAAPVSEPVEVPSGLPQSEARARLDVVLSDACDRIFDWHRSEDDCAPPRIGIRATVGLGKTAVSRRHLVRLQARLRAEGRAHRILVFTPSHILAEESAADWRESGVTVAVHRGYEAQHPLHAVPMCRDLDMVRMAITSGLPVFPNSCLQRGGSRCHAFDHCLKQENLREIETAEVVIAPYDALFTGLTINAESVALLVIDEGCWARALRETRGIYVETLTAIVLPLSPQWDDPAAEERAWQRLFSLRQRVATALSANGCGPVLRSTLAAYDLTEADCSEAAALEIQLRADPKLRPGLPQGARRHAAELSAEANRSIRRETLLRALAQLLHGSQECDGRVRTLKPAPRTGIHEIVVTDLHSMDESFAGKPVLHLDATLRPALAGAILPGLDVSEIYAEMPYMSLTLVPGSFGKSTLCGDDNASVQENKRRKNRLHECVDYVRWQAIRTAPGRILVVTYKACEAAFANIPGVDVAHFNAIAGLDIYRNVAMLIVIGRPLPQSGDIHPLAGAFFGLEPTGGYAKVNRAVLTKYGDRRTVRVLQHEDAQAEILRAAICDDEVIQAIGRGRGVNRTADNPLEVQVLADVALPVMHDRVVAWDHICPDVVQRMLLVGFAVDSPADAAALHPKLFDGPEASESSFRRAGFNRQNLIGNSYREMTVKSARYRKPGRGQSWQRAYWLDGDAECARRRLEAAVGALAEWAIGASC